MKKFIDLSNYALSLEKIPYLSESITLTEDKNVPDEQTEAGLKKVLSGQTAGSYTNQWNQLIADYEKNKAKAGTYTVIIRHDNGQAMVKLQYGVGADGKPVKGSIKLASEAAAPKPQVVDKLTKMKLTQDQYDKLKARGHYLTKAIGVDEAALADLCSAIVYHAKSNSLSYETRKEMIADIIGSDGTAWIDNSLGSSPINDTGLLLWKAFANGGIDFPSEDDSDCQTVKRIIGPKPKIGYTRIVDDAKISELAQAIFNILDDTVVTTDEELTACFGIAALDTDSVLKLDAKWKSIHMKNANNKSILSFAVEELDSTDSGLLLSAIVKGQMGIPNQGAKDLLK